MCKLLRDLVAVVGNRHTRKAFYTMSFQRIGDIAARLIADPAKLAAAAQDTQRMGGDEPVSQGGGPSPSPIAAAVGGDPVRECELVAGKDSDPRQPVARGVHQTIGQPGGMASIASLTVVRDMMVARNAKPQGVRHDARPARVSATIISMSTWREVHCPPAQAARSGSAKASSPKAKTAIQSF